MGADRIQLHRQLLAWMPESCPEMIEAFSLSAYSPLQRLIQLQMHPVQALKPFLLIKAYQLRGGARSRRALISDKIRNTKINLMAHCGYYR